jgi:hypothetical protein
MLFLGVEKNILIKQIQAFISKNRQITLSHARFSRFQHNPVNKIKVVALLRGAK